MNFEIPEGANIQIIIGRVPPLALTDQRTEAPVRTRDRSVIGTTLKFAGIAMLVFSAFWVGEQRVQPAQAFPNQAPAPSQAEAQTPGAGAGQVPPDFQAQLQQPPSIQPAPGQNTGSGGGNNNPFGLQQN
jgi:hypothetical protein